MEDGTKPTHPQLQKDLSELRYVSHVAKKYNVTSRTITKWFANYEKYNELIQKPEEPQLTIHPAPPTKDSTDNKKKKCLDCTKMVFKKCTRCNECNNKYKIKTQATESNRPSLEQLKNDLKELKSMVQGKKSIRNCINSFL
jgi:DNA invertase Pin-like site-specific DNA recombinase